METRQWFEVKLNFFASDLLRDANARFRMARFCEMQNTRIPQLREERQTFNVSEIMSAMHSCFRSAKEALEPERSRDWRAAAMRVCECHQLPRAVLAIAS